MRLHWLDSVVPNGLRTAGFLTGSVSGPLVLPLLKHKGDRGRCGYYLSSSQIPSISPSSKMKRRRARQRRKKQSIHIGFIWKGKCFCVVAIDVSAAVVAGICTYRTSNLYLFILGVGWSSAVLPSAHARTHLLAHVSLSPPRIASSVFCGLLRDQQLIIVFCTYVMQMSLYGNWHNN